MAYHGLAEEMDSPNSIADTTKEASITWPMWGTSNSLAAKSSLSFSLYHLSLPLVLFLALVLLLFIPLCLSLPSFAINIPSTKVEGEFIEKGAEQLDGCRGDKSGR